MIRKTITKLVYGLKTKLYESGKRKDVVAVDHHVDLVRGGGGPPLLYLHSIVGETSWLPFHQELAKKFDVIAPAHPGVGSTEAVEIDLVEDVVFHYLDLLDALGVRSANVVGASFGGWIAAELAVRAPDRVRRLVLVDAFGLARDGEPEEDPAAWTGDVAAMRRAMFADPGGPMADIALPFKAGSDRVESARRTIGCATALAPSFASPKLARRLRRITCPTLVIWGDRDRVVGRAQAEALRDGIEGARLVVFEGCGHLPAFEAGGRFVETVTEFLGGATD